VLPRGRARCEISAKTPAAQGYTGRIDDRESERKINNSLDYRLPIGAQGHVMLDQHFRQWYPRAVAATAEAKYMSVMEAS
jgi:hypothetical protein